MKPPNPKTSKNGKLSGVKPSKIPSVSPPHSSSSLQLTKKKSPSSKELNNSKESQNQDNLASAQTFPSDVDTIFNRSIIPPATSNSDVNGLSSLPPACQADPLVKCIAGLISNILPPPNPRRRVTKDIYVGIPCNADKCCIDKFLGRGGGNCCGPSLPPCCAKKQQQASCGPQKCCCPCPAVAGAAKCCPKRGRNVRGLRNRKRTKSQKTEGQQFGVEENNNMYNTDASRPTYRDGGNYAQMTDAAVDAQIRPYTPNQRNVITGMMSRTMIDDHDVTPPPEEVVVTPPRTATPSGIAVRSKSSFKGPRLTRFLMPEPKEDDRSTRTGARLELNNPSGSRGSTNFTVDNKKEATETSRGRVWPLPPNYNKNN